MPRGKAPGRRRFMKGLGALTGAVLAPRVGALGPRSPASADYEGLALVLDPADPVASSSAVEAASDLLRRASEARGLRVRVCRTLGEARPKERRILAAGSTARTARPILDAAGIGPLEARESLALAPARHGGRDLIVAASPDGLGLAYALADLAERIECSSAPDAVFASLRKTVERPTCRIRSINRLFVSDVEDKPWFHDRSFWPPYLDMLVAQRFNRLNLAFGIGYDFARQLRDTYLYFAYPFLLAVPGHDVRARGLRDEERDRNLEALRYISGEAARRGLHFQLGLWTHAFQWTDSPHANYVIDGLSRESHAAYCRDAVRALLEACPHIHGLTIRTHGESGVAEAEEGRYEFWQTLFSGIARASRPLEIDLHAKGVDQKIIDLASATGVPVRVSPKFWAEHMGLPYLQSSIRALELPKEDSSTDRLMALSTGSRNHMRYSYGDLLTTDRRYGILHRVWPGTERLLLWGEPAYAAQMSRAFSAFGADGVEYMEPLSFKGRKGSGLGGGRDAYADASLRPAGGDWRKYEHTYRLWGRLAYDPGAEPETWRRHLHRAFGKGALPVESGLAAASRILPLISSAHCPSAANNNYWPEMYTNMSLFDGVNRGSYSDTPTPRVFGMVSSLDPQLFASVDECAEALLRGESLARMTPIDVARQLDEWASASIADLSAADAVVKDRAAADYRRLRIDCAIAAGIGRFFAAKLRAGVLFAIFDRTGQASAREAALGGYREARRVWADFASGPAAAYARDVTFGFDPQLRGHWQDRLPAIDRDIAALETLAAQRVSGAVDPEMVSRVLGAVHEPRSGKNEVMTHVPSRSPSYRPGAPLPLEMSAPPATSVRLHYRHLNQAETWRTADMQRQGGSWRGEVPGEYTRSAYPLQYYFEARFVSGARLWPGFGPTMAGRPYFVAEPA